MFKLRNFESVYRGGATEASAWVYYTPVVHHVAMRRDCARGFVIIPLDVGWLALLILTRRQCEGLNIGIGAEVTDSHVFFLFPPNSMITPSKGSLRQPLMCDVMIEILRTIVHYGLHYVAPILLCFIFFKRGQRGKAFVIMLLTNLVDLDHLLASPMFDPHRMSIDFHLLHTYPAIIVYVVMCFLPYERLRLSPLWRAVGIGLTFHMITDWQDYVLWMPYLSINN